MITTEYYFDLVTYRTKIANDQSRRLARLIMIHHTRHTIGIISYIKNLGIRKPNCSKGKPKEGLHNLRR